MTNIIPFDIKERSKVTQEQQPVENEVNPLTYIIKRLTYLQGMPSNTTVPALQYITDVEFLLNELVILSKVMTAIKTTEGDEKNE